MACTIQRYLYSTSEFDKVEFIESQKIISAAKKGETLKMATCERIDNCRLFKEYQETNTLGCMVFIKMYCKGFKPEQCVRRRYVEEHGIPTLDNMVPLRPVVRN